MQDVGTPGAGLDRCAGEVCLRFILQPPKTSLKSSIVRQEIGHQKVVRSNPISDWLEMTGLLLCPWADTSSLCHSHTGQAAKMTNNKYNLFI